MPQGLSHLEEQLHIRHMSHRGWSIILNISDISYGDRFLSSNFITLQAPPHLGEHLHVTHTSCDYGTIFWHIVHISYNNKTSKSSFSKYITRGVSYSLRFLTFSVSLSHHTLEFSLNSKRQERIWISERKYYKLNQR